MSSNVRRHDRSCHNDIVRRDAIYQCRTCDVNSRYYICARCFTNGDHTGHEIVEGHYWEDPVKMCNCGELHGRLECRHHQAGSHFENDPLYTETDLRKFTYIFDISSTDETIRLARLNQICCLSESSPTSQMIRSYFENSNAHGFPIKIERIFSVMRKDSEDKFVNKGFEIGRRMLLWHGTTVDNLQGILSDGFKTPEELNASQNADGMFGPGVYFADRSSKSFQYTNQDESGLLLLCEVAVGSMLRVGRAQQFQNSTLHGYDSIKAVGKNIPDKYGQQNFDGNIIVPAGRTMTNPNPSVNTGLEYNEYVIFDPARILVKFIVQVHDEGSERSKYNRSRECWFKHLP